MERKSQNILILGATSAIGRATAMAFAEKGATLCLGGREKLELERISTDIQIRYGTKVYYHVFDIEVFDHHQTFVSAVLNSFPHLDGILFAIGYMGESLYKTLNINFNAAVSVLEILAQHLEQQKSGFIIAISSCAGDRGRQSNYFYGAAKGGLNVYLEGLRNRLFKSQVKVITIKPGFVDTKMTYGLPGLFLVASPQTIGQKIAKISCRNKDVCYLPWFWRYIMLIIKNIPEFIFKRMSL